MSGGSYGYVHTQVRTLAEDIRLIGGCSCASPKLRQEFKDQLEVIAEALKAIDWNDSGDGDEDEVDLILACLPKVTPTVKTLRSKITALKKESEYLRRCCLQLQYEMNRKS
jgi:hypothetical protein